MMGWLLVAGGLLVAGLGVLSAVASSAVHRVELYRWSTRGVPNASAAERLLAAPDRIVRASKGLATLGMLVVGLGTATLIDGLPIPLASAVLFLVAVPLALTVVYAFPRTLGRYWPERIVGRVVPVLARLVPLLSPLGGTPAPGAAEADVEPAGVQGEDGRAELTVLSGVLAFTERPVREVMTPRTDIVAVPEGASLEDIGRLFVESGYSRLPVYRESLDHLIGMIYAFDLLKITPGAELPLRPIATAPASKRASHLLFEMQRDRRQIAVVLDEYGGTAGIVTFEDLLEELIGEIFDEHDGVAGAAAAPVQLMEVSGGTPVEEIVAAFDVTLPDTAETVSGLLARLAGRIPRSGERYLVAGLEFDVLDATPNRLERVLIRRGPVPMFSLGEPTG
jgi:CBS domain containing-hemolysin-like protein